MKWLKRKLYNWVSEIDQEKHPNQGYKIDEVRPIAIPGNSASCDKDPVLNFRVFSAVGGRVIEFRHHDEKTDRTSVTTYIVKDDEDFGDVIKKISTMEMLK